MEVVRIDAVERHPHGQVLLGSALDAPRPGDTAETYSFNVNGWAIGRDASVESLQVLDGERILAAVPPNRRRPDVAAGFAGVADAETCGFEVLVRAIELEPSFTVDIAAVLGDGTRQRLATLRGRRERMTLAREATLNPIMLTTIGRSGSKWLAWLLSCHPAVVAFQPLELEPRVAAYWMTVFRSLTAPSSYMRQVHADRWDQPRWWLGDGAGPVPAPVELGIADWLGTESVHALAAVCQERMDAFYLEVAKRSGKPGARYFAEKFLLDRVLLDLTLECFPAAREVILVRDFRDRLSSVLAWNEKNDDHGFGHDAGMSEAEYLTEHVLLDAEELLDRRRRRGRDAHVVRYEELVLEPHSTLTSMFEHLGLEADEGTVDAVLELARAPGELLDTHRTLGDPMETIGRWRRDLPPALANECNRILAPVLDAFGYPTDLTSKEMAS
ncbi:MAG TPA: sulfotransferase [Solirubrobacteraceae bacterium]|nr:sulfotransferase [Solirubrobacteraceae bacterium]